MPRNRTGSKWRKYLIPAVVMVVVVELYNITRARLCEFLLVAFASGSVAAFTCGYRMTRSMLDLEDLMKVPILKISPNLKKIITGETNHVIPYVKVEGQVKSVHQPIRSIYIDGMTGVMQKVGCREYTSKWHRQKKKWVDTEHSTNKASKTVPFVLKNEDSSVKVKDPEEASGLELTTFYDKFHPISESLFQSIIRWFNGSKVKGHQNVELILQEDKTLTAIGELRISRNNEVEICPPSDGLMYILASSHNAIRDITGKMKSSIAKWKKYGAYSYTLTAVSYLVFGLYIHGIAPTSGVARGMYFICGPAILTTPPVFLYFWLQYRRRKIHKTRTAFNARVQAVEDHVSDDESEESSSLSSEKGSSMAEEDDRNICVVCMSEPRDCVLVDCGHVCVCRDCAQELNPYQCPICRTRILQIMPIYNA